jgi:HemX protein
LLLVIFIFSLLLYFIDVVQPNRKVNQAAFWLLAVEWGLQLTYLVSKGWGETGLFTSQSDTLFFYAWLIISFSLLAHRFLKLDLILFLANIVGFVAVALSVFLAGREFSSELAEQLASEWILIHITLAFLSYAAFTISCILSLLYVLEHFLLKKKKIKHLYRWPGLARLDSTTFLVNMVGFPLLLASLVLGLIRADDVLEIRVWQDVKVWFSALVIGGYSLFFYLRLARGRTGKMMAQVNIACFLLLLANYFISVQFTQFHT